MNPRNKSILADSLLDTQALLTSILESDELSEWSRAGVFGAKKKVRVALDNIIPTEEDFIYAECQKSPKFFIENFVKIRTVHGEFIKFTLNEIQNEILNGFSKNDKCFVKRPRQCGSTHLISAYILWCSIFSKNESIIYFSPKFEGSKNCNRMMRNMYDALPDYLKVSVLRCTSDVIEFENGNRIVFTSASSTGSSYRACSLTRAFFDDYRFYVNFNELIKTVYPCFRENPKLYFVSCKNKHFTGNVPACDWVGSFDITNLKSKDIKWVVHTIKSIGIEQFEEEYM